MTSYAYRLLNVFAKGEPFSGNPLCVFEDAAELDGTTMQALAKQFNLSETTFILPSQAGTARVRIFTPDYEMPFAGHPTLGTAAVVASRRGALDAVTLEMTAGLIPVRRFGSLWTLTAKAPAYREAPGAGTAAAALLGVDENAIGDHPVFVDTGREQLIVPFRDPAAVRAARPNPAKPAPELLCDDNHLHLQDLGAVRRRAHRSAVFLRLGGLSARRSCHRQRVRQPRRLDAQVWQRAAAGRMARRSGSPDGPPLRTAPRLDDGRRDPRRRPGRRDWPRHGLAPLVRVQHRFQQVDLPLHLTKRAIGDFAGFPKAVQPLALRFGDLEPKKPIRGSRAGFAVAGPAHVQPRSCFEDPLIERAR